MEKTLAMVKKKPDTWSGIESRKHWVTDYKNFVQK